VHEEESGKACRGQSRRHHMGGMQEGRGKRCRRPRCPTCSAMTAHVAASKPCSSPACRMRAPSFTNAYAVLSGTPYMPSWMLRTQREAACRPLTYFSKYTPA
jgi:hypothetical protein